ncbi:MAG: hypothetical protein P8H25_07075 [Flavobacteriaceae bacterium]|nr:hypothetical protein [Flavobacteriaceae bacterium]
MSKVYELPDDIKDFTLTDWKEHLKGMEEYHSRSYSSGNESYIKHLKKKIKRLESTENP